VSTKVSVHCRIIFELATRLVRVLVPNERSHGVVLATNTVFIRWVLIYILTSFLKYKKNK
jgi:hypothetical protein